MKKIIDEVSFCPISQKDANELFKLDCECFSIPWSEDTFYNEAKNEMAYYVTARINGKIIGYLGYWRVVDEAQITNIAVKKEYRRCGIGEKLLFIGIENAKKDSLSSMTLEVRESNIAAISLYSKNGFCMVGERKGYYHQPLENAVLMKLDL